MREIVLIVTILLLVSLNLFSISKSNAVDCVIDSILVDELDSICVYVSSTLFDSSGFELNDNSEIVGSYDDYWTFYIDDMPGANWNHPVRYLIMDLDSGNYYYVSKSIYPKSLNSDFEICYTFYDTTLTSTSLPLYTSTNPSTRNNCDQLYAVIICGQDMQPRWWQSISALYCTLKDYGYSEDNIFVHFDDGTCDIPLYEDDFNNDDNDDIDYNAYLNSIKTTFKNFSDETSIDFPDLPEIPELTINDQLLVVALCHGRQSGTLHEIILPEEVGDPNADLTDTELSSLLRNVDCAQIIFNLQNCYGGGFIPELDDNLALCENRIIATACSSGEYSNAEIHIARTVYPNIIDDDLLQLENFFYYIAPLRGYYPFYNESWNTYSQNGSFDFSFVDEFTSSGVLHPLDYIPDFNQDAVVTYREAFDYANDFDSWSDDTSTTYFSHSGYYNPYDGGQGSGTRNDETPLYHPTSKTLFSEFACLNGIAGRVCPDDEITSHSGGCVIGGELVFDDTLTFTFEENSIISLTGEGKITVNQNAKLIFENNVTVYGNALSNMININGDIEIGDNVSFIDLDYTEWGGVIINTATAQSIDSLTVENCTFEINNSGDFSFTNSSFEDTTLEFEYTDISIDSSILTSSEINQTTKDLSINESTLTNTPISAIRTGLYSYTEKVIVDSCSISNTTGNYALKIEAYPKYEITNSSFDTQSTTCVYLYESGFGSTHLFEDNEIDGNSDGSAIYVYDSSIDILGKNNLHHNDNGVFGLNNSNIYIVGNQTTPYQTISNNIDGVRSTHDSFPTRILYTDILSNSGYHVKCSNHRTGTHDIANNYWGNPNDPSNYLYPDSRYFDYTPVWTHRSLRDNTEAHELYEEVRTNIANGNFIEAKNTCLLIVENHQDTEYAKGSLKNLLRIENQCYNDYLSLQHYFLNNPTIRSNEELRSVADDMANICNLYLLRFEDAIEYYESIIQDPESPEDSLFAVVDLGYTYVIMDELGYRDDYVGYFKDLKPTSREEFSKNRDLLLRQLYNPINENDTENIIPRRTELNENYPNPFNPQTTISYNIANSCNVLIEIFNIKGQKIKTLVDNKHEPGSYTTLWNGKNDSNNEVSTGIYFCKLKSDKQVSIKKLMMLK